MGSALNFGSFGGRGVPLVVRSLLLRVELFEYFEEYSLIKGSWRPWVRNPKP